MPNGEEPEMVLSELRQTEHLSASSIGEYVECSLLYKFGRIDKLPMEFKSDALEFGTCIHRVLEQFFGARMIGEKMLLKEVHRIFETTWKGIADRGGTISATAMATISRPF
jgi:putative RecB family exonuclease